MLAFRPCFFSPQLFRPISVRFPSLSSQHVQTLNPNNLKAFDSSSPSITVQTPPESGKPDSAKPESANNNDDGAPPPSKVRNVFTSSSCTASLEKVAELKKLAPQLKKKPSDFKPESVASLEKGQPVPFLFLALAFDMIAEESGRIVITDIVCNLLRTVIHATPDDLVLVVYLSANRIAPAHEGLELGIGDASIIKVLAEACGRTEAQIKNQYKCNCGSSQGGQFAETLLIVRTYSS